MADTSADDFAVTDASDDTKSTYNPPPEDSQDHAQLFLNPELRRPSLSANKTRARKKKTPSRLKMTSSSEDDVARSSKSG